MKICSAVKITTFSTCLLYHRIPGSHNRKQIKVFDKSLDFCGNLTVQVSSDNIYRPETRLRKGNVFTSMSQEFCPQGEVYMPPSRNPGGKPPDRHLSGQTTPPGRHPSGQTSPQADSSPADPPCFMFI